MGRPRKMAEKATHLGQMDLAKLLQIDAENRASQACVELAQVRVELARVKHELEAKLLVERARREESLLAERATQAREHAAEAAKQASEQAKAIGQKYAANLSEDAFDPLTGEIKRAQPQIVSPQGPSADTL